METYIAEVIFPSICLAIIGMILLFVAGYISGVDYAYNQK